MKDNNEAALAIQQKVRGKQAKKRIQEQKAQLKEETEVLGTGIPNHVKQCSKCGIVSAVVHCYDCDSNFCEDCDEVVHEDPNPATLNDFYPITRPTQVKPSKKASLRAEKLKHNADLLQRIVLFKRKKKLRAQDLFKTLVRASNPPAKPAIDQLPSLSGTNHSLELNTNNLITGLQKLGVHCTPREVALFMERADEINSTESPAAMKSSKNIEILTKFYRKADPERIPEVERDLAVGKPKILLGALQKRYGEAPELMMMCDPSAQRRGDKIVQLAEFVKLVTQRENAMNAKKLNAMKNEGLSGLEKMKHAWHNTGGLVHATCSEEPVPAFDLEQMERDMRMMQDHERYKNRSASLKLVAAGQAMGAVDWMFSNRLGEPRGDGEPANNVAVRKIHNRRPLARPVCSRCNCHPSTMHCPNCDTAMCERCDLSAHQHRLKQDHRRSSTVRQKDTSEQTAIRTQRNYDKNPLSARYIKSIDNVL
jgi:hypothetical protein